MIREYIDLIDKNLQTGMEDRESRYGQFWGIWSRQMNQRVTHIILNLPKNSLRRVRYSLVRSYWVAASRVLELHYKRPILAPILTIPLKVEMKRIKEAIYDPGNED